MLKKNDEIISVIENYGYEGEGVARFEGIPVFVPFAAVGDKLKIKIVKVNKTHMFGIISEIIEPSPARVIAPCSSYGKCGGCNLMHLNYEEQLKLKRERVADCIRKIAKIPAEVLPVIPSDKQFNYRNKVQMPVGEEGYAGFYAVRSHRIVKCDSCYLQDELTSQIVPVFLNWMKEYNITGYNEEMGKGILRHLFIRSGTDKEGKTSILVMPVINANSLPYADELKKALEPLGVTSICININKKNTNVILGDKTICLYGDDYTEDVLCENTFKISPESFYQVNKLQAEKLYYTAMEMAGINENDTVYDLYCGAGTITLCASKYAGIVYGIEIVPEAVENAKENAKANRIKNVEFICGDVAENVHKLKEKAPPDVIILDPPRKGCNKEMLELLKEINSEKIVYISCNPATLARDLEFLCGVGYSCSAVQPVDLFPNTSHVECCTLLCRKD